MPRSITLTFPWPPRELSPNVARGLHWGTKAAAASAYKRDCYLAMREQFGPALTDELASPVLATATFYATVKRKRDMDNLDASLKALFDTLVTHCIITDDSSEHLRHAESKLVVGTEKRVEVTLEEIE